MNVAESAPGRSIGDLKATPSRAPKREVSDELSDDRRRRAKYTPLTI